MTNRWKDLIAVTSLAITIGFLIIANREIPVREVTRDDTIAEAAAGGYQLIDLDGLRALC